MIAASTTWTTVRSYMQRACGVVLAEEQSYLLEARLGPVAKQFQFGSIAEFVVVAARASAQSPEAQALIEAMTTHETSFFRDAKFWQALEEGVLPPLIAAARTGRPLRIWSAACSTGQEPYSLAMLLSEKWPDVFDRVEILATDVSEISVERAKRGFFSTMEVNRGLGAARLVRHFDTAPGGFQIKAKVASRISWSSHNLLAAQASPSQCDIVLCRNVLIYFDDLDRAAVVKRLVRATVDGGFVAVGCTESLVGPSFAPGWYRNTVSGASEAISTLRKTG